MAEKLTFAETQRLTDLRIAAIDAIGNLLSQHAELSDEDLVTIKAHIAQYDGASLSETKLPPENLIQELQRKGFEVNDEQHQRIMSIQPL